MPRLISGSTLRRGGSGEFIDLRGAQPQLPPTETTATGFTLVTDELLRTRYRSSLGFVEFSSATLYSSLPDGQIRIKGTGTSFTALSTNTGALAIDGGIGINGNIFTRDDIVVNGLTIGQGFRDEPEFAWHNIVIKGAASTSTQTSIFSNGQRSIAIGYDTLNGLSTSYKNIAIGEYALSTGTGVRNSVAIGSAALKEVGTTPPSLIKSIGSVTLKPRKFISTVTNTNPVVATVLDHGLTTGSRISITGVVGMNTGTFNLLNNNSFFVDVLTTDTVALYYDNIFTTATQVNGLVTTPYESDGTFIYPVEMTVDGNDYVDGTAIVLSNLDDNTGLLELNLNRVYTLKLSSSTFQIYYDVNLDMGIDGTDLTPYVENGLSTRYLLKNDNIAIGVNAGRNLYDGEQNFFMGFDIAKNLTTGSYNFFLGHEVANNMTRGSGNISIMGDNLVDGRNNQINIGGVFYYNGGGFLQISSDTGIGIGTASTSSNSGALVVFGGAGISEDLNVAGSINHVNITRPATSATLTIAGGETVWFPKSLTFPVDAGTSTYVLTTDGFGALYWSPNGSGGGGSVVTDSLQAADDISSTQLYPVMVAQSASTQTVKVATANLYFSALTGQLNATDFNSLSDVNKKENIETITNALEKVQKMRGVSYVLKESKRKSIGVIAQEVFEVIPEVVSTNNSGEMSVAYGNLIGLLIEAIKEQQQEIEFLKSKI